MQSYIVEFLGTFFFLFIILYTGNAFSIGAALVLVILLGAPISGGNFNPAVTIMLASAGKLPLKKVIPYILAQVAGGLSALVLYKMIK
jgi:aquaporin Z